MTMARSKSTSGYPAHYMELVDTVGRDRLEVRMAVAGGGTKIASLRTTLQCFFAAVRKEGSEMGLQTPARMRAENAAKIVVRIQGDELIISHRDFDETGLMVQKAVEEAKARSVARHEGPLEPVRNAAEVSLYGPATGEMRDEAGNLIATRHEKPSGGMVPQAPDSPTVLGVRTEASKAMLGEIEGLGSNVPGATVSKLPPIQSAPGTLLDMVAGEGTNAPRPDVVQKYRRADGREYPQQEDGEPTWGFNPDGEPKVNQFF